MIVGVLALQGDFREHIAATISCGHSALEVRTAADLAKIDALILPGGESTTIIHLAQLFDLYAPIKSRIAEGLPVYGSCAGMILLADRIVDGKEVQVLSEAAGHAVAVRQGNLLATSFHPELTADMAVHSYFFDEICS